MSKSVLARQQNNQFQLTLTIPANVVRAEYEKLLKEAAKGIEVPGFRKGNAPVNKVEDKVDKGKIYEQVLQKLLPEIYISALKEHELKPIIEPKIELIDSQEGNDWQIRATACEKPEVLLGDYKKGLKGLLKSTEIWTPDKGPASTGKKVEGKNKKNNLAKSHDEKKQQDAQKVTEWLLKNAKVEPAEVMIEQHANQLLAQLLDQIQKLGITLDQYISSTGKKIEDLKAEYAQRARENLKLEFDMLEFGIQEKIEVTDEEIDKLINGSTDSKMKEALKKPEQKHQLHNVLFRQKVLDQLINLAS